MSRKAIVFVFIAFALGLFFGSFVLSSKNTSENSSDEDKFSEVRESGYKFISPLLECEPSMDSIRLTGLNSLQKDIADYVESQKKAGNINDASVYFRDLNNGPWIGVNEHAPFSPASLLKLPVMMAYYKKSESAPDLLSKKVKYDSKEILLEQAVKPTQSIKIGKEYTIDELIESMMVYSDNAALSLLEENIEPALIDRITLDLGVETATANTPEDFMSVKGYSGLFRILYNASYLKKDLSEKALEILSKTEFKNGIVAGIPHSIVVSHKFGERELQNGVKQLHDCGIVYRKGNPYLVCIMTRGNSFVSLERVIAQISSRIYDALENKSSKQLN